MRALIFGCLAILIAACSTPPTPMSMDGRLEIIGPSHAFSAHHPPGDWVIDGTSGLPDGTLSVVDDGGIPALQVLAAGKPYRLIRRIHASMLATPYLGWSWVVNPDVDATLPMRLVVGFKGGMAEDDESVGGWSLFGDGLPDYDRMVTLGWGTSALMRGHMTVPPRESEEPPFYIVRGGNEFALKWRRETVDLSALYGRLWPDDDPLAVQVVFVGIWVGGAMDGAMRLTGLSLFH